VFRGHFRSPAKQVRIKDDPHLDAILPLDFFKIEALCKMKALTLKAKTERQADKQNEFVSIPS
jgi:hypothetical protein